MQRKRNGFGKCIYCNSADQLTDEHVLPCGIGGTDILKKASCSTCAKATCTLEQRILRGHWWPYRRKLGILGRRPADLPAYLPVTLHLSPYIEVAAKIPTDDYPMALFYSFPQPSILEGTISESVPAGNVLLKIVGDLPSRILVDGGVRRLNRWEKVTFPIRHNASDIVRFVAKIAHAYSYFELGAEACQNYLLPKIVLGDLGGAQTYVGCRPASQGTDLDASAEGLHAISHRIEAGYLVISMQFFRDGGDFTPIYEAVVGPSSSAD